ncbi:probable serine/threonine-protein kinase At1g09600 [Hibiscus syriacus]|uniref:probable serine/threonine-protein kinase At1g09600 n=1 Tax=Hibiscus syriacus TaxID=106335 RepID=UPI001920879A|nr:probable serine/threonine-protein kinase At1g09600 [Hibiscus syriacus]
MGCMFSQEPQGENVHDNDNEKAGEKKNDDDNGEKGDGSNTEGDKEGVSGGWPSWLASVAGEAVDGWLPRKSDSFEKLEKIGQGTYSSVYKARDLETDKIVAMKKVRFVNMEPLSVRFMAREIIILRKLDHPNVMKLECIVTSRMSSSLYLVFEYMEHDLAGLAATPGITLTEPQIKCYMQQLFRGIEHCHSRGVLHRDLKGSNLLINDNGILKIADFGLGATFQVDQKQPLTSRVVTLWYRAPELLLGETEYGVAIDLWSAGCILAELFFGKPIMPGRTEVEQMHKIFKLCGSPSEEYWQKTKLSHATSFKPQQPYQRCLDETFRNFPESALSLVDKLLSMDPEDRGSADSALSSEFFTSEPLPCDPSYVPKYPPCKELDVKLRCEEARRKRAEAVKRRGAESIKSGSMDFKGVRTPEFIAQGQSKTRIAHIESGASGFQIDSRKVALQNGLSQSTSMIHPSAAATWNKAGPTLKESLMPQETEASDNKEDTTNNHPVSSFLTRKNRFHCSGPLMPPGGNIDDILKEHEKQIQQAVRKARLEKA